MKSKGIDKCKVHHNDLEIMCATCRRSICYVCGFDDHRSEDHVLYYLMPSDRCSNEENKQTEEVNLCTKHNRKTAITCNTCNEIMCYMCAFHEHRGQDHVLSFPDDTYQCNKHMRPLTALCNSCNKIICNVCAFHSHRGKDHVIFSENEVDGKVDDVVKLLLKHVETLDNTLEGMKPSMIAFTSPEATQDPLDAQFDIWSKQAEEEMSNIGKELELHKEKKTAIQISY